VSAPSIGLGPTTIDAFTGEGPVSGQFASDYRAWALAAPAYGEPMMQPDPPNPQDWRDERVGWGIILPERDGVDLAKVTDAPTPIQELVAARSGKILRYAAGVEFADWKLRDYAREDELFMPASPLGMGPNQLPKYLLICARPDEVPWHIQYGLNPVRCVGRLDLAGEGLDNYVDALLNDWAGAECSYAAPVTWAVEHDANDITALMRDAVAEPIHDALCADPDMPLATFVDGRTDPATLDGLCAALKTNNPALVVTSSHGMTGPLSDVDAMRSKIGMLVDQNDHVLDPSSLLANWQPDGAVWFAQACCSAGSDDPTSYGGLFEAGSSLDQTLAAIANVGATTAPLPQALLGASKPARAFIGHVEPTFDWTLSFPPTQAVLTDDLKRALYDRLASGFPVGLAMSEYYNAIGSLLQKYENARRHYNTTVGAQAKPWLDMLVYSRVTAHDRANTVILGDPTVAMALPGLN
jgi:hypothetical protein